MVAEHGKVKDKDLALRSRLLTLAEDWEAAADRSRNGETRAMAAVLKIAVDLRMAMLFEAYDLKLAYAQEPESGDVTVTLHLSSR